MSSTAAASPMTPRQVTCETSDQQQIAVELEALRLSHTFDDMYKNLGLEEGGEFPGTFPVKNIKSDVFKKVVDWCKAHKGQPDPVVEKDPFTRESKRFEFTDDDHTFFDVPALELLDLVMAASYLDIRGLYHYGCQAIADLLKGKETLEARYILQQTCDLTRSEIRSTRSQCPWLDPKADILGNPGDVSNPIYIPTEVLTTIFEKLTRADLERLQLVSQQFRGIILHNEELPLRPLNEVRFTTKANYWDYSERDGKLVLSVGEATCLKGCAVRKLVFRAPFSSAHCTLLLSAKSVWKDAVVSVLLDNITSPVRKRALTDLLFCRELRFSGFTTRSPYSFMHLPAIRSCNYLGISNLRFRGSTLDSQLKPADIVEWLEHDPEKEWNEPRQMDLGIWFSWDRVPMAFLSATGPKPFVLRIGTFYAVQVNQLLSNAIGEQLRVHFVEDDTTWWRSGVAVERK